EDQAFYFKAHEAEFPGLIVQDSRRRVYPYKNVACHLLGTMRSVDENLLKQSPFSFPDNLGGYRAEDRMGESGMERLLEKDLHGTRGCRIVEWDLSSDDAVTAVDEDT